MRESCEGGDSLDGYAKREAGSTSTSQSTGLAQRLRADSHPHMAAHESQPFYLQENR